MIWGLIRREERKLLKVTLGFLPRAVGKQVRSGWKRSFDGGVHNLDLNMVMADTSEDAQESYRIRTQALVKSG